MEGWRAVLVIMALLGSALGAGMLAPLVLDVLMDSRRRARMRMRLVGEDGIWRPSSPVLRMLVRVQACMPVAPSGMFGRVSGRLVRLRPCRSFLDGLHRAGCMSENSRLLFAGMVLSGCPILVILPLTRNLGFAFGTALLVPVIIWLSAMHEHERRGECMREQLPAALSSIEVSLGAGKSLAQALAYAAQRCPAPLANEIQQTVYDIEAGRSLAEAMDLFEQRTRIRELAFVTTALSVQQRSGGSLRGILQSASQSVRDSLDLKRTLKVQTAQNRLSTRIVMGMPLVLLGALMLISPSYLMTFFRSTAGIVMFCLAVTLDVAGFLVIRKLLKVEV